jgi:hypothetical protein
MLNRMRGLAYSDCKLPVSLRSLDAPAAVVHHSTTCKPQVLKHKQSYKRLHASDYSTASPFQGTMHKWMYTAFRAKCRCCQRPTAAADHHEDASSRRRCHAELGGPAGPPRIHSLLNNGSTYSHYNVEPQLLEKGFKSCYMRRGQHLATSGTTHVC